MNVSPLQLWGLPRARYDQMIDVGLLGGDDKVELLDGLLVAQGWQSPIHAMVVRLARAALKEAFARRYHLREETPIALDRVSEPEPDISVVPGRPRDYLDFKIQGDLGGRGTVHLERPGCRRDGERDALATKERAHLGESLPHPGERLAEGDVVETFGELRRARAQTEGR